MYTLEEFKEKISEQVDEVTLLEILELTSADLVENFEDEIRQKWNQLMELID